MGPRIPRVHISWEIFASHKYETFIRGLCPETKTNGWNPNEIEQYSTAEYRYNICTQYSICIIDMHTQMWTHETNTHTELNQFRAWHLSLSGPQPCWLIQFSRQICWQWPLTFTFRWLREREKGNRGWEKGDCKCILLEL